MLETSESLQAEGLCAVRSTEAAHLKRIKPGSRFILRWNKSYHLLGPDGRKHEVWKIARGKPSWEHRMLWDARRRCQRKTGVIALPIRLPDDDRPRFLVVSRPGYGRKPWYLITTEPVYTAEQAWSIIFA